MAIPSFLGHRGLRLLVFGGKGGVGKTTCATATSLRLAKCSPEVSFLLVSTDPAHSLADSLAGSSPPPNLGILELNAKECLETFKIKHTQNLREIVTRGTFLDDEDISKFLNLSLPGLDELMATIEISRWVGEGKYDCIVLDTAPTGHTLRLLTMPELIRKWLHALDAFLAKHRYMKQLYSSFYYQDELDKFLLGISSSVKHMEKLLRDSVRCLFVPVMLAEVLSVQETLVLLNELEQLRVPVNDIVVNKLYPKSACWVCTDKRIRQVRELRGLLGELSGYSLWGIPMYPEEVRGLGSLEMFWDGVSALDIPPFTRIRANPDLLSQGPQVEVPRNPPSLKTKLLVFAGKGGVGKTTLACATAVRMIRDLSGRGVFLFSTDPAPSLSHCMDVQIGPKPTRVVSGLTAMEIDAPAEFEILKNQYLKDLEKFLGNILPNFDLTFDRRVMECIMDLSPPGIEEVMSLALVIEFLAQNRYDIIILDSASTGHLIRLLETPELIEQWLKVFFNLFLKYKNVFRLPRISQRLIQMSKDLKLLRTLLRDPSRSAMFTVTILTEMAFQETKDLVAACERMGISVPMIFLNLATPATNCSLCSALHRSESQVEKKFQQTFPGKHQTLVYSWGEPRGLQQLGELGGALYKSLEEVVVGGIGRLNT